jgi:hypothetical protein
VTGGRLKNALLLGLVVVMVNLPFVHSSWQHHRLEQDGVTHTAVVTDLDRDGEDYYVRFRVEETDGQPQFDGRVRVDESTYDTARDSHEVEVRSLPGSTAVWDVEGEVTGRLGLVITLIADLSLLVMVLLLVRFGSRLRSELVLVATEDLTRCPPGPSLDAIDATTYVVCGEVDQIEDDAVVLDLGDRRVRVLLDGHVNPAGYQQPVRAVGTMHG